jgi:hypothetical protein
MSLYGLSQLHKSGNCWPWLFVPMLVAFSGKEDHFPTFSS